jgi:hypothetical protein
MQGGVWHNNSRKHTTVTPMRQAITGAKSAMTNLIAAPK